MIEVEIVNSLHSIATSDIACLDPTEQERYLSFQRATDAADFLSGRRLVRQRLGRWHGLLPAQIPLVIDAQGRPACPLPGSPTFSISHAGGFVAVAWCELQHGPLGLDIQPLDTRIEAALVPYYMSGSEQEMLASVPAGERADERLRYFVLKEAVLKCHGSGFRVAPESITVEHQNDGDWLCTHGSARGVRASLHILQPPVVPQAILAAVASFQSQLHRNVTFHAS